MNEAYYEEIFAESEEMTIEAVTEPPAESVTEVTEEAETEETAVNSEYNDVIPLENPDNISVLEALNVSNEQLIKLNEYQTEVISQITELNEKLTEMNQYIAYIFVIVLAFVLYRILGGVLSSIFSGS